jgi:hypothetical protein
MSVAIGGGWRGEAGGRISSRAMHGRELTSWRTLAARGSTLDPSMLLTLSGLL